ncbi:MAG: transketolase [Candidatus Sungbacteria bacterium]|uniref:Transketolase n=1 Tax=Candidatus Sungiibacteriota bacterium TaxID=2750080 RepID=A0A932VSI2_9BACT|nr:transketolase [Candidatus Sungbacteria bacterium]
MRMAFIRALCEQAERNDKIWLLCGDIGYSVLEEFAGRFPERFVNVGVAEQNMIGVAAGLALSGKTVFTYTIGNFSFMRSMEQIRNEVCYHNLSVNIVAVGGGFSYGNMGYTHHAIEDLAMLSVLPNIRVVAPGDPVEVTAATHWLCDKNGPGYLRLGRGGEPVVHASPVTFSGLIPLRKGKDAVIVSSAGTLDIASQACQRLTEAGISTGLVSMPLLSPFSGVELMEEVAGAKCLLTVEEHAKGGLASKVAEALVESQQHIRMRSLRVTEPPAKEAGDRTWQRNRQRISEQGIVDAIKEMIG